MLKPITLILPYYDNPGMFRVQQDAWAKYPAELKALFHVVVVDDCSPRHPARPHVRDTGIASFRLYRTLVDVRWNWLFCRNLGASEAQTEWLLLTDMDHVPPRKTVNYLVGKRHDPAAVYRFARRDAPDLTPYKPHPNSWFMTVAMFDRIGGYDERFSGYYGTDGEFRDRVSRAAKVHLVDKFLVRYPREVVADASTTAYGRKEPQDAAVMRIRKERESIQGWRPLRLTFPWERLL